jgi:hypothetical protein
VTRQRSVPLLNSKDPLDGCDSLVSKIN